MAKISEKYMGTELFGSDNEKVGAVKGLLTDDDRRQFYVVQPRKRLFSRQGATYYVPAERGVVTGGRRLEVDVPKAQFEQMGWANPPADIPSSQRLFTTKSTKRRLPH